MILSDIAWLHQLENTVAAPMQWLKHLQGLTILNSVIHAPSALWCTFYVFQSTLLWRTDRTEFKGQLRSLNTCATRYIVKLVLYQCFIKKLLYHKLDVMMSVKWLGLCLRYSKHTINGSYYYYGDYYHSYYIYLNESMLIRGHLD